MPFLGLLANHLLGNGSFAIAIVIAVTALLLYRRLAREDLGQSEPESGQSEP